MKICGIITEYNPFHLGHEYQISKVREAYEADIVIVVMSGHFVQRGEPAVFDQFTRTRLALAGGADIVIQLPTYYATASAENFAYGAVSLLHALGVVDILCFGSESGDIQPLKRIAEFLHHEPANFKNALKSELKNGHSFAKARSLALTATYHNDDTIMKGSNNILGIEYIKSLLRLNSHLVPVTIQRVGASYLSDDFSEVLPSATAIRGHFASKEKDLASDYSKAMPEAVINQLLIGSSYLPLFMEDAFQILKHQIALLDDQDIEPLYDVPLQLFNRLKNNLAVDDDYESFLDKVLSKNYTRTSIQRSLIHLFLNIRTSDLDYMNAHGHQYIRVLGFRKDASKALHAIKNHAELPIITNVKDHSKQLSPFGKHLLETEIKYTKLYHQLVYQKFRATKNNDYRQPMIVV